MMYAREDECAHACLDAKEIERIARGLDKYARAASRLGITIFGGSGAGSLRHNGSLIIAEMSAGNYDGGDGACWEDDEGLLRGEGR